MARFKLLIKTGGYFTFLFLLLNSCSDESVPTGTIFGKVWFKGTTVPISDVLIKINGIKGSTSEIGNFSISNIPIGKHEMFLNKSGFSSVGEEVQITDEALKINFELTSELFTSSVFGRIQGDQTGNPKSGIKVLMLNPDETESSLQSVTDVNGEYSIANIPQGERTFIFLIDEREIERRKIDIQSWDYALDILIPEPNIPVEFTDERDGNTYQSVLIGNQTWMIENLRYLPGVHSPQQESFDEPRYYVYLYYGNDVGAANESEYYKKHGVAYNFQGALNACPDGWHLPTDKEWNDLQVFLGMNVFESEVLGYQNSGNVGFKLKSTDGWPDGGNGDNSSHMNIVPAGGKMDKGSFYLPILSSHWTSTEFDPQKAWIRAIHPDRDAVNRVYSRKENGNFIRCIKNK
jgi:uncharacterized protein (TIGR02145 family)